MSFRGLDAPAYYALRGRPRRRHHRHRQHARLRLADRGSDGVRRHAQLGDDLRRRRLPHRPRERARPAPLRAVRPARPLLTAIATDPVLSRCKLIAEPWDATGEGYRVGGFGVAWSEWNGRYRDAVRDFWRGPRRDRRGGVAADRQRGPLRAVAAPAVGVGELHHRARRVHPARPRQLRAQAQRGQRRGQPRRHRRQPLAELRRRGRDDLAGDPRAAAGGGAGAARHAAAVDGDADGAGRRRAVAHPGRQQQRLLPRRRDVVGATGRAGSRPSADGVRRAGRRRSAARRGPCTATASTATATCTWWHFSGRPMGAGRLARARHPLAGPAGRRVADPAARRRRRAVHAAAGRPVHAGDGQHPRRRHPGEHPPAAGRHHDHPADRARCCSCTATSRPPRRPARAHRARPCTPAAPVHTRRARAHRSRPCTRPTMCTSGARCARPGSAGAGRAGGGILRPCRATTSAAASAPPPSRSTAPWPPPAIRRAARTATRTP